MENHKISHSDLLGQQSGLRLWKESSDRLRNVRVTARHPTIDEFTTLSPRRVAPIYAAYASTIVSLLDINPDPPSLENDPTTTNTIPFQLLEAGTGHGSLTIHLARAIAAANLPVTQEIIPEPSKNQQYKAGNMADDELEKQESSVLQAWRKQRRAIIHTVDIDPDNRYHADRLIKSYRGAMYWPHIDFNSGNVKEWITNRQGPEPFLDAVLLDMPGVEQYISAVVPAMKERGHLLVFVPQLTQIAACVQEIALNGFDLKLDTVLELGDGVSTGRNWDVRMADLKNSRVSKHAISQDGADEKTASTASTIPPMVCRPIVGEMTRGGGFIGLWKKISEA